MRCSVCGQEKADVKLRDPCAPGDPMCGELANYYCGTCWSKRNITATQIWKLTDQFLKSAKKR